MKNSEYWEKRIANSTWKTYNSLEEENRALLEMYKEAALDIEDELYRLATKMKTATPMLSDMHKYNRLDGLKNNIDKRITKLSQEVEKFGTNNMYKGFKEVYKNVATELVGTKFDEVPEKVMKEMLDRPWIGSNFSKRLWKNTKVLELNLNDILVRGLTQGKTVTEMAIELDNRMQEGFNVSHRLIRTETMHYLNMSSLKAYEDTGCKEVQVWAAKDERTCPRCGAMHGKKYPISKAPVLPFHAHCRCTYLPVIDEKKLSKSDIKSKNNLELEKLKDIKVPLAKRHNLKSIGKQSSPKEKNTIILPEVDYQKDIEDIKKGLYNKVNDTYIVNKRIYGIHDGRFYPIEGEGFVTLNRNQYKLLKELKINSNNPYMDNIKRGLKLSETEEKEVYDLFKLLRKEK